jgi:hypothetical protein
MAEYTGIQYPTGASGYFVYAGELGAAWPAPDVATSPSLAASLALTGYTSIVGSQKNEGTFEILAAGLAIPVDNVQGRREPVISGTMYLSTGSASKAFLQSASRYTSTVTIPDTARHHCMPIWAAGFGYIDCDAASTSRELARFCMTNTLSITAQIGQPAQATFEAWPLYIDEDSAVALPTISEAAIRTAGGNIYTFADAYMEITDSVGTTLDYIGMVDNVSIQVSNNLRRRGQHHVAATGDADARSRSARDIVPGIQRAGVTLGMTGPLPAALRNATGDATRWGTLALTFTDGVSPITIATGRNVVSVRGQNPSAPDADLSYTVTLMASGFAIT